jgi:hypothetical protein
MFLHGHVIHGYACALCISGCWEKPHITPAVKAAATKARIFTFIASSFLPIYVPMNTPTTHVLARCERRLSLDEMKKQAIDFANGIVWHH